MLCKKKILHIQIIMPLFTGFCIFWLLDYFLFTFCYNKFCNFWHMHMVCSNNLFLSIVHLENCTINMSLPIIYLYSVLT